MAPSGTIGEWWPCIRQMSLYSGTGILPYVIPGLTCMQETLSKIGTFRFPIPVHLSSTNIYVKKFSSIRCLYHVTRELLKLICLCLNHFMKVQSGYMVHAILKLFVTKWISSSLSLRITCKTKFIASHIYTIDIKLDTHLFYGFQKGKK